MTKNPFINASSGILYIILVASLMFYGMEHTKPVNSVIVPIAVLSLLLLSHLAYSTNEKLVSQSSIPQNQVAIKTSQGLPVRLIIPSINVNASIQQVGFTKSREMEVPSNTVDVGWFKLGPHPGERGSAVIDGHFDGDSGKMGVFTNLYKLKQGNKLYIKDDKGISTTFVVRESRTYDPGYADDIFSRSDGTYLNLITCDGVWDGDKKSYSKRLVVFADIIH